MKVVVVAIMAALLAIAAHGPAMAKGKRGQQAAPKAEDAAKKKAGEEAYQNALKAIPTPKANTDPWQSMR